MPDQTNQAKFPAAAFRNFTLAVLALALAFIVPLGHLLGFALGDDLHSHILLIPFISAYLVWLGKNKLPPDSVPAKKIGALFFAGGGAVVVWHWWAGRSGPPLASADSLGLTTLAFVLFLTGLGAIFLGGATLRSVAASKLPAASGHA